MGKFNGKSWNIIVRNGVNAVIDLSLLFFPALKDGVIDEEITKTQSINNPHLQVWETTLNQILFFGGNK